MDREGGLLSAAQTQQSDAGQRSGRARNCAQSWHFSRTASEVLRATVNKSAKINRTMSRSSVAVRGRCGNCSSPGAPHYSPARAEAVSTST